MSWFLMYSFLVGSKIAVCHRIKNALDPIRFDVTIESLLFSMRSTPVVSQPIFASEWFVTQTAGRLNFCVDSTSGHWERFQLKIVFHKCCRKIQHSFGWLGWLAITDWPLYNGWIWFWDTGKLLMNWVPKFSSFRSLILAKNRQGVVLSFNIQLLVWQISLSFVCVC